MIGALDAEMKAAFGISHFDHALLLLLFGRPHRRARMTDIARALRVDASNIAHRVRRLERQELVERMPDPSDGRATYAGITAKGRRLLRDAWPRHHEGVRRYFLSYLPPGQLALIAEVFSSIVKAGEGGGPPP